MHVRLLFACRASPSPFLAQDIDWNLGVLELPLPGWGSPPSQFTMEDNETPLMDIECVVRSAHPADSPPEVEMADLLQEAATAFDEGDDDEFEDAQSSMAASEQVFPMEPLHVDLSYGVPLTPFLAASEQVFLMGQHFVDVPIPVRSIGVPQTPSFAASEQVVPMEPLHVDGHHRSRAREFRDPARRRDLVIRDADQRHGAFAHRQVTPDAL